MYILAFYKIELYTDHAQGAYESLLAITKKDPIKQKTLKSVFSTAVALTICLVLHIWRKPVRNILLIVWLCRTIKHYYINMDFIDTSNKRIAAW